MQGALVRVARPEHQEDRMVSGRGREAVAPGQVDAHSMAHYRSHYWADCRAMLGKIRILAVRYITILSYELLTCTNIIKLNLTQLHNIENCNLDNALFTV